MLKEDFFSILFLYLKFLLIILIILFSLLLGG